MFIAPPPTPPKTYHYEFALAAAFHGYILGAHMNKCRLLDNVMKVEHETMEYVIVRNQRQGMWI